MVENHEHDGPLSPGGGPGRGCRTPPIDGRVQAEPPPCPPHRGRDRSSGASSSRSLFQLSINSACVSRKPDTLAALPDFAGGRRHASQFPGHRSRRARRRAARAVVAGARENSQAAARRRWRSMSTTSPARSASRNRPSPPICKFSKAPASFAPRRRRAGRATRSSASRPSTKCW